MKTASWEQGPGAPPLLGHWEVTTLLEVSLEKLDEQKS